MFEIIASRESVCAGDDTDAPHEYVFSLPENALLREVMSHLAEANYLARVTRASHIWGVFINGNQVTSLVGNAYTLDSKELLEQPISEYIVNRKLNVHFTYESTNT